MPPHAYVVARHIERTRALLLDGVAPADAVVQAGCYDQAHLTRHFRRHVSVPPGAFAASVA